MPPASPSPPLVSAIVTTHNYGRFLPDAIESVLAQTHPALEIVVVDDGSTDDTPAIVGRYADRGIRYVRREQGGAGAARNTGLAATSAALVAFLDADDAWLPERVALGVAHLERHPQLGLVAAHAFACDETLRPSSVVHAHRGAAGDMLAPLLVHNVVLNPSSVLIRRSALEAAGGFSEIPFGEDWDTWIAIAKRAEIGFVDDVVALVRRHASSVTPNRGRYRVDVNREIVERHLGDVHPAWRRPLIRRSAASAAYLHAGLGSAIRGDRRVAQRYAVSALALDPFTLPQRKLALAARVFVSEDLVLRLRRLLRDDEDLAEELVGSTAPRASG